MNPWAIPPLITFVISILTGVVVFRGSPDSNTNRIFLILTGLIALLMLSDIMTTTTVDQGQALTWHRIAAPGWILLGPAFLQFTLAYTHRRNALLEKLGKRMWRKQSYPVVYGLGLILVGIFWTTDLFIAEANPSIWGVQISYTVWLVIPIAYSAACGIPGLSYLYRATAKKRWAIERRQAAMILTGALVGGCGLAILKVLSWTFASSASALAAIPLLPATLLVAVAILKYRVTHIRRMG